MEEGYSGMSALDGELAGDLVSGPQPDLRAAVDTSVRRLKPLNCCFLCRADRI